MTKQITSSHRGATYVVAIQTGKVIAIFDRDEFDPPQQQARSDHRVRHRQEPPPLRAAPSARLTSNICTSLAQ